MQPLQLTDAEMTVIRAILEQAADPDLAKRLGATPEEVEALYAKFGCAPGMFDEEAAEERNPLYPRGAA